MSVREMARIGSARLGQGEELAPTRRSLLERLRDMDDAAAWQEFFDTYWKLIYCAAVKGGLSDDEAEEVVQETVIGVARRMENFRYQPENCSFKGWLMHITRRRIIDRYRKRQTQRQSLALPPADPPTGTGELQIPDPMAQRAFEELWDEEWEKNLVDAAMELAKRTVKPEHYQIFYLHRVKGVPAREISRLMGVSTAKVYVVRHRVERVVKRQARLLAEKRP
jgi:RNA polymerase sigma factor (sigma-70 family)